jgi:endonuclease/exonuclease/phosphatase (EEP) superfamily protein YafD
MKLLLQFLAFLIGVAAFLPLVPSNVWWIRGFDFPRMQLLVLGILVGGTLAVIGIESWLVDGGALGFLILAVAIQGWWMRPYSRLARRQVLAGRGEEGMVALIANVLMTNRQAGRLIGLIRETNPDIILAVETDAWWMEQLRELAEDYPHAVEVPQENTYGMVLRSRLPLIEPSVERLVKETVPSIHTGVRLPGGEVIHLHALHPKPPFPDEDISTTARDGELLVVGKQVAKRGGPTVVVGDLNDVAWSETTRLFQKISGLLDPRIGRGRFSTYHAGHWWLRWPLDHIFLSRHFRLRRLELLRSIGSDHFPILADLSYEPERKEQQSVPAEDQSDRREAEEKITEANA